MICRTLRAVSAAQVQEVCLVVHDPDGEVARLAVSEAARWPAGHAVLTVRRAAGSERALSVSLRAGVERACEAGATAVLVCLGDMPLITPAVIDGLTARHRETGADVVFPVHDGKRGNPVLWDRRCAARLLALSGDQGARSLFADPALRKESVPADASVLADFDTPDALDRYSRL